VLLQDSNGAGILVVRRFFKTRIACTQDFKYEQSLHPKEMLLLLLLLLLLLWGLSEAQMACVQNPKVCC
jgi:hypothetical protein